MPTPKDSLTDRLSRNQEITLTVTGRSSGRASSRLVWFVAEGDTVYLLPADGTDTQWYKNVLKNPAIRIQAGHAEAEFKGTPVMESKQVSVIVERFRIKYGDSGVKLYRKLNAAVIALPKAR
jgi:deazaflavin-dependent oxidoreductase (nitroreductase family)